MPRVPRRSRLAPARRRRTPTTSPAEEKSVAEDAQADGAPSALVLNRLWHGRFGLQQIAQLLWLPTYHALFMFELEHNERMCVGTGTQLPPSTYRARLQGERAERYDMRRQRQRRDELAIARHANNQWAWSPSLLARSVAYYKHTTNFMRATETGQRRLASRPVTLEFLRMMRDCQPAPEWPEGRHVSVYVADQTYQWVGVHKHGRRGTLERHDGQGMPIQIQHEVYINSIKVRLPASLGDLSPADLARIAANHGSPYTEDYANVFEPLRPHVVQASLDELADDALAPVQVRCSELGVAPAQLSLRVLAVALYGRGTADPGGPTVFDILEALERTNTMSYEDFQRISAHVLKHDAPEGKVTVVWLDGQGCVGYKNLKKRFSRTYARFLIGVGGFHEHAHSLFAFTETLWEPFFGFGIKFLKIERVLRVTQNLEHNAYGHHQNGHHVTTLASLAYLIQDVRDPPPELLLRRGLAVYMLHVQRAGGRAMCAYLHGGGLPALQWQRAGRNAEGGKFKLLLAYSFHLYRSTCHKPVAAQIVLIALLGFECALPALQTVLLATMSLSLFGRLSACVYSDRLLEFINNLQQGSQRSASSASFGHALDLTTLLRSMLHVRHAFQAEETGTTEGDDPITESMLVQARLLQNEYRRILGDDLTVPDGDNPFHHTGLSVPLDAGDYRFRRPWEWVWRTAEGRSAGKGRRVERWDVYVRRFLYEHFFPF